VGLKEMDREWAMGATSTGRIFVRLRLAPEYYPAPSGKFRSDRAILPRKEKADDARRHHPLFRS